MDWVVQGIESTEFTADSKQMKHMSIEDNV